MEIAVENVPIKGILKIQRPLATNASTPQALCYNECKDVLFLIDFNEDVEELFEAEELKVFCEYTVEDSVCHIGKRVEDRCW